MRGKLKCVKKYQIIEWMTSRDIVKENIGKSINISKKCSQIA